MSRIDRVVVQSSWIATALAAVGFCFALASPTLAADDGIFAPGEPIVTGFSGTVAPTSPPDGSDPLDYTFINPEGLSVVIQKLQPEGPAAGQLIDAPTVFSASATDVGQVFGVALDDAPDTTGAAAPNIYVAATSAFGLNIVVPDADGNPVRSRTGADGATFMPGQWGSADGAEGYPGSIWKIDGTSGEITLFSTIAGNSGAGLGGIAFDPGSQQMFVSDLDSGLIYRLDLDGTVIDSYDHGTTGRPAHDLDAVADDGSEMDITDPAFNSEDPNSWGFTQPERKVTAVAIHSGRLYYAVEDGPSIWSVGIKADGTFGAPRWEIDVTGLTSTNAIAGIAFDPQGRMLLAQRGPLAASYDYSVFATANASSLVRYKREAPDDPTTPSVWVETPDSYAIGLAADGTAASGGVAVGYGFDEDDGDFSGAPGGTVWATGDALRNNPDLDPPVDGPMQVQGLQGMAKTLIRPANDPAVHSFFTDFDGNTDDATATEAGHVGAVAIWQVFGEPSSPPDIELPDVIPPPDYIQDDDYNLTLEKWSAPHFCFDGGADYWCKYTIRIENTGTVPYWGPLHVHDFLPGNPPGATMHFWPTPPWFCGPSGPGAADCVSGPVLLYPGDGVVLHETVKLPKPVASCHVVNVAGIVWPFFGHDDDDSDDVDGAISFIPGPVPGCAPPGGGSNLTLSKFTGPNCFNAGATYDCIYGVLVQNAGPGNFTGAIVVKDTLALPAPITTSAGWTCALVGPVATCHINAPPVNVPMGWVSGFFITQHVPKPVAPPLCDLPNKANIFVPAGGAPSNFDPSDDFDAATAHVPSLACVLPHPHTDLQMKKTAQGCFAFFGGWACEWQMKLTNLGPNTYTGPLAFRDTSALAVANTLVGSAYNCTGTAVVNCNPVGPAFMLPNVPELFSFYTFYNNGPTVCSATNNLGIVNPSPGSVPNPSGNDSASASQPIPNPACLGHPALSITKTAKGCTSDPSGPDWLCKFDVKVKNDGGVAQPPLIQVRDVNLKPTTFNAAGNCSPFGASVWQCTRGAPLAPGASWTFQATTHVDPNGVTLADCDVVNSVWISNPFSADPGHFAQASQKVPQLVINTGSGPHYVYCDPPSLKLTKTALPCKPVGDGYDCGFTVAAESMGPDAYQGTVEVDELLPDNTSYKSSSWACTPTTGNDVHCSSPEQNLAIHDSVSMTIVMHVGKTAAVRAKCDITNEVSVTIPAEVLHGEDDAQYKASAKAKLPTTLCQPAPVIPKCPDDSRFDKTLKSCVCIPPLVGKAGQCHVPTPSCADDSHYDKTLKSCVCDPPLVGKPGQCHVPTPSCADDSHYDKTLKSCVCDPPLVGKPGQCHVETPACPDDSHFSQRANGCVCNPPLVGKAGQCEAPTADCADDSHFDPKRNSCVCNRPLVGQPGQCQVPQQCPSDSHFDDGQCLCNQGTTGRPGRCQVEGPVIEEPSPTQCPSDSTFSKRANACVCNRPLVGKPGNCVPNLKLQQSPGIVLR